jgi:hypothetical protein
MKQTCKLLIGQKRKEIATADTIILKEGTNLTSEGEVPTIRKQTKDKTAIIKRWQLQAEAL